jgi:hypothetical protein
MLVPLISESAIKAVFTFAVMAVSSTFCPSVVSDEEPDEAESPGLPAAPGEADPLSVELAALDGLVEELDGLEDEDALDGLDVDPEDGGLEEESAVVAGFFIPLVCLSRSCPTSQPAKAKAMADAMRVLFQIFIIVSFSKYPWGEALLIWK